jgi:hypothetical protein
VAEEINLEKMVGMFVEAVRRGKAIGYLLAGCAQLLGKAGRDCKWNRGYDNHYDKMELGTFLLNLT